MQEKKEITYTLKKKPKRWTSGAASDGLCNTRQAPHRRPPGPDSRGRGQGGQGLQKIEKY